MTVQPDPAQELPSPLAKRRRIALWDNARFLLIVLVVIGHAISTVRTDTALAYGIYTYIYLFHMPAMIYLSGLFSRPETSPKAIKSTWQLVVTWLLWEGIWALIHWLVQGNGPSEKFLVTPAWTLWFLVSLVTMRILLPYLAQLKHPLAVSIGLALASGLLPAIGTQFSASRTLVFLPFFVAGWLTRRDGWLDGQWFASPRRGTRVAAWALLAAVAAVLVAAGGLREWWRIDKWLTWRDDYFWLFANAPLGDFAPADFLPAAGAGIAVTAVLLALAAAMTLALLIVAPRAESAMTAWGSRTLYVYLLHAPIIWFLRRFGVVEAVAGDGVLGILAVVAFAIVLAMLLSGRWAPRVFGALVEPRLGRIYTAA